MSNSSQQPPFTNNFDDFLKDFTINVSDLPQINVDSNYNYTGTMNDSYTTSWSGDTINTNTITLTSSAAQPTYTLSPLTTDQITILGGIDITSLNQNYSSWGATLEEWRDRFPDWYRVQDMCTKYPALDIALRNLRTIYDLVKSDYDAPKE